MDLIDRGGRRTTELKTEGKITKLQKITKETKEEGQGVIQALPFFRHNCQELLVTDDFTATQRSVDSTHIHTYTQQPPLILLHKYVGTLPNHLNDTGHTGVSHKERQKLATKGT